MKLQIATSTEAANKAQWVWLDGEFDPAFAGNPDEEIVENRVGFLVRPQTRAALDQIERKTKFRQADLGDEIPKAGSKGEKFIRAMADFLIVDWQNVFDENGEPVACDQAGKYWLFQNLVLSLWVMNKARNLTAKAMEEEEKN